MEKVDVLPQEVVTTITNEEKEIEQNEPIKIEKRKPKEKPPKQPITDNQKIALEKARKVKALKQELQKHEKEMKQKPSHRKTPLVDNTKVVDTVIAPTPVENNDKMTELLSRISTLESALNEKKKKPAPIKEQDIDIPPVHSNPTYPFIRRIPRF